MASVSQMLVALTIPCIRCGAVVKRWCSSENMHDERLAGLTEWPAHLKPSEPEVKAMRKASSSLHRQPVFTEHEISRALRKRCYDCAAPAGVGCRSPNRAWRQPHSSRIKAGRTMTIAEATAFHAENRRLKTQILEQAQA